MLAECVIQVSVKIKTLVSSELLTFVKHVLGCEALTHWPVDIWPCRCEGVCDDHIRFGLCETEYRTRRLFLHEVAHAIFNPKRSCEMSDLNKDSYWHKYVWQEEFSRLCRAYLSEEQ